MPCFGDYVWVECYVCRRCIWVNGGYSEDCVQELTYEGGYLQRVIVVGKYQYRGKRGSLLL